MTGESVPVRKGVDARSSPGTVNGDAALRVRVTAAAADNTIARVVQLVEEAQESKAPTERFIDRFSRYYTPGVMVVAALVAIVPPLLFGGVWSEWIYKGLAILLIGCPCALVISTPAAIAAGAVGRRAARPAAQGRRGARERSARSPPSAFDKTGTLTEGKPGVTDVVGVRPSRSARCCAWPPRWRPARAIRWRARSSPGRRRTGSRCRPSTDARGHRRQGRDGDASTARQLFLGSPQAAAERVPLSAEQKARIAALNDEGKTVSVLVVGKARRRR